MPIRPPALDDRSFDDLVEETLARIPAHTPEWTNPTMGDPGRTMIDLFAWLTDTLLYRANLIPERQRLAFLRLLGMQMRPAQPAQGLVSVVPRNLVQASDLPRPVRIRALATIQGSVGFETRSELTVLPVSMQAYYKRPLSSDETDDLADLIHGLQAIYAAGEQTLPYVTTPVFSGDRLPTSGFDLSHQSVDRCLWLALLAPSVDRVESVRERLGDDGHGGQQLLNIGLAPAIQAPDSFEELEPLVAIPHLWEMSAVDGNTDKAIYHTLDVVADSTAGLTRRGVQRLLLPSTTHIGAPQNDVRQLFDAGVGDQPPRIDDPAIAERLVTWLRLRPSPTPSLDVPAIALSWIGVNAVEIDQRQTRTGIVVGQSDGTADQVLALPDRSIEAETLHVQVEQPGQGYRTWQRIDDLELAGRDAPVYVLDSEAGTLQFGNNVRGRLPETGMRVRVAQLRAGGGVAGNLPAGSLSQIRAIDQDGNIVNDLEVVQPLATKGGVEAESLVEAEQRIPGLFRHRDRVITAQDYRDLAADTPGVRVGRVEVLSQFRPHQRLDGALGVISVMVLPRKEVQRPSNPRPDRYFLEAVFAYLDARRPLGTELYVIGCEYVPIGIGVSIEAGDGFARDQIVQDVRDSLYRHLWPLSGGGALEQGWPLGATVRDRELEVAVARVPGVRGVRGINLFAQHNGQWHKMARPNDDFNLPVQIVLKKWQLPELLSVVAVVDQAVPEYLDGVPNPYAGQVGIAVPVVPEVCT